MTLDIERLARALVAWNGADSPELSAWAADAARGIAAAYGALASPDNSSVAIHYVCAKGYDHWLSHSRDWGPHEQSYDYDGCRVEMQVESGAYGHTVHLRVLPDVTPQVPPRSIAAD